MTHSNQPSKPSYALGSLKQAIRDLDDAASIVSQMTQLGLRSRNPVAFARFDWLNLSYLLCHAPLVSISEMLLDGPSDIRDVPNALKRLKQCHRSLLDIDFECGVNKQGKLADMRNPIVAISDELKKLLVELEAVPQ